MDFTASTYRNLIHALLIQGFSFQPFADFILNPDEKVIVLRHDVDLLPSNSLEFAKIQSEQGILGSYYFRFVPQSYNESIIKKIRDLGHEIGYHYETMDTCFGEIDLAYNLFCVNLEKMRKLVPVKTICMHGSPISKFDNRLIWQKYDYHKLGLIGEPYFDVDFGKVLYLTDTGRRWDGDSFNVRDKAQGSELRAQGKSNPVPSTRHPAIIDHFHSTFDIIKAAEDGKLPDQVMITFHPQRWTDKPVPWVKELVWQNTKNLIKYFIVKLRP